MINKFINTCREKGDKTAFVCGKRRIFFSELLDDVFKMVNLFKNAGLSKGTKVLLLVLPSYEFYVLLLACIYYGVNVVVMDSYKDFARIRQTMADNSIKHVFCNRLTAFARLRLPSDIESINITDYRKCPATPTNANDDQSKTVLTTFTSGTTGKPKPIERSIACLAEQIETVSKNIEISESDIVCAGLPIYVLFVVYSGLTCVISRKINKKELSHSGVNAMLAPISKLLKLKKSLPFIKKLYVGGAMLYSNDVEKLKKTFPVARATYIYGASECVLMAKSTLDHYLKHSFALGSRIDGVELSIVDKDKNGIGRIKAVGKVVLAENGEFIGNDIGYIDEHGLHIVGRSHYSIEDHYNYVMDDRLLSENLRVKNGFSFAYKEKIYFCYEGRLSKRESDLTYIKFRKLPMDQKHRTKLDYRKVIEKIESKNKK